MKAYEEELEEPSPEALQGHIAHERDSELSDLLLNMVGEAMQVVVLLNEAGPEELEAAKPRLQILRDLVGYSPAPKKVDKKARPAIGFRSKNRRPGS